MSCCCGEESDDFFLPLQSHPPIQQQSPPSRPSSPAMDISDSSSVLSDDDDILRCILLLLPPHDLGLAACVCRLWRSLASDRHLLETAFKKPFNVNQIIGTPTSTAFWRIPGLDRFAISHRLRRGDSVAGLALKYSVQVMDIKRFNNMMSEHGIYSRERLLIPINNNRAELLSNSTCYIELDIHAKREVAVLYLDEEGRPEVPIHKDPTTATPATSATAGERRGRSRMLIESVKRCMHVDDGTAAYYLSVSDGDPRAAIQNLSEDLSWEQQRDAR